MNRQILRCEKRDFFSRRHDTPLVVLNKTAIRLSVSIVFVQPESCAKVRRPLPQVNRYGKVLSRVLERGLERRCVMRVKPERAAHGRARWAEQIEAGRVLRSHEIEGLGQKGLSAYLRAMDIKVGKEMQRDAPGMRDMLRKRLRELNTHEWSVPSKAQKS